ncbi:hypothetical protein N7462_008962 [Penicillium macrosclerotiorum]|uniref:uncharacterized protein n=1 Tax=Penicillium macrosclerotiorum TaxID=303699 RepID=UPI0025477E36|nr:uncharacterized protein N7462_008962 [Penicillium macrosclerotiorum]KAJ5676065.1 hypothetical protein N7462_008962 [Penicillium macrosclerotiorum]
MASNQNPNHTPKRDADGAEPATQCHFSGMESVNRLQGLLPGLTRTASPGPFTLPTTTSDRRRASIIASSLDQDAHLSEKVAEQQESGADLTGTAAEEETVLYLAYGSNLASKTFCGMRGIKPLSQIPVLVPELRLTFDLPGIPYAEPCFAGTQFRDPSSADTEDTESEDDFSVVTDRDFMSEKVPLMTETRELRGFEDNRNSWHKPLVGVVYEVTLADYAKIIATEGGGGGYRDIVIDCYAFANGYKSTDPVPNHPTTAAFKAHTLLSPAADDARKKSETPQRNDTSVAHTSCHNSSLFGDISPHTRPDPNYAQPSARYLNLLVTGASEHDLPVSYQTYLSNIHSYQITTFRQKIGKFTFLVMWGPLMLSLLGLSRKCAGPDGRSPPWLITYSNMIMVAVWASYDYFFKPVFGDGERTLEDTPSA